MNEADDEQAAPKKLDPKFLEAVERILKEDDELLRRLAALPDQQDQSDRP